MEYDISGGSSISFLRSPDAEHALKRANLYYMGKFIFIGILCFILYNTGSTWIGKIINTIYKGKQSIGVTLVARTTSSLAIWFLVHSLIMIHNQNLIDSCQFMIHISWKWLHSIIYFGIWIGFWFIPDDFFDFYMKAAIYISGIYLVIQIIILVDFFHSLNDKFAEEEKNHCILLVVTIILTCLSLTGFGLEYYVFGRGSCTKNIIIISINLVISVILFIVSLILEHGSIFTSSLILLYTCYLTCAGLICEPSCNSISKKGSEIGFSIVASILTLIWAGYSALSSTSRFTDACTCSDEEPIFSLSFFHAIFALASVYLTMIVTHWGLAEQQAAWTTDRGKIAMWINFAAAWVTQLLYLWTLIAPMVCPDRDFS